MIAPWSRSAASRTRRDAPVRCRLTRPMVSMIRITCDSTTFEAAAQTAS